MSYSKVQLQRIKDRLCIACGSAAFEGSKRCKAHRDAINEANRKGYRAAMADPDKKEQFKKRVKRWQKANPDKVRAAVRQWQKANPDKVRAEGRDY